ncbi:hypothetical protein AT15_05770 [Kosmotoga arenicorallina S304]|uniref:EamA domain-containing protein n=1 Tax=Kosmotoga arenicorallina S304 TaxID=1453497 RepID=A0A182C829_9BACT|nr:DMT family transporter [Kosmotoga arenicorallina]OAA31581.1 hypothetical protein AT15_05770 [Kosmotoga arenicorallina S304]
MAYLYLGITLFFFSSMEVISKPLMGSVDPFFLTFLRFFIGGLFLLSFVRKRLSLKDILLLTLVGSLNSIISMTALQLSVKHGVASTAATLVATNPIFVSLLVFIAGERLTKKKFVATVIGLCGIVVFAYGRIVGDTFLGIFFGLLASLSFALYSLVMKRFIIKFGALVSTAYSSFFSSLLYGILLIITGKFTSPELSAVNWLVILYLGVGVTGVAYLTFFRAMELIGASAASRIFYLKPIVSTFFAVAFLSEQLGVIKIIGTAIVIISLFL